MNEDLNIVGFYNTCKALLCSGAAALITRIGSYPFERIMVLKMAGDKEINKIKNPFEIIYNYYKTSGIKKLYVGNTLNCFRILPLVSLELFLFEKIKNILVKFNMNTINDKYYNNHIYFISGALGGGLSFTMLFPLEFSRVRCILKDKSDLRYLLKYLNRTYKEYGIKYFYNGSLLAFIWYSVNSGLRLFCYEFLKKNYYGKREDQILINNNYINLVFGCLSCFIGVTISYPLDYLSKIRIKQIINNDKGNLSYKKLIESTYNKLGYIGFYRGLV